MRKKQKSLTPRVFFNASVILAGLRSPKGGSGKLLSWARQKRIKGVISEVVFDETLKHADKIGVSEAFLKRKVSKVFRIYPAPKLELKGYRKTAVDYGDVHLFTSGYQLKVDYLVSLDKKHVLVLSKKIAEFKIVSPGELIKILKGCSNHLN